MDRLIKPDVQVLEILFIKGQKCYQTFKLTNLMHTMSVAISLTTSNSTIFSFSQPFSIIPPLSTSTFSLYINSPSDQPPLTAPPDTVLVRSTMLPTGKAHQDDLRRLFSKPGPHIFKDAILPISFVGPEVAEFLLSPPSSSSKLLEINFLFSKAISTCDESQLNSLLRFAIKNGNSNSNSHFISTLIEAGGDVNSKDSNGESLMSMAVKSGDCGIVQILIESGFVINNKIDLFLHIAATMNRVDIMEILCLSYVDIDLNSRNSDGQTALHLAAIHGQVEAIQFLVSVGSEVDITDNQNWTPLHYAAEEGHFEAVQNLLNHSVYGKYAITREGKTAFALAVEKGNSDLYDSLHLGDLLQRAARIDDVYGIKNCLAQGAKINGRDQNGWTPLHRATFKGNIESVRVLVSNGARVDLLDDNGYTPLLRAVEGGHVEVAMYLLAHGAKDSLKSIKGLMVSSDLECFKNYPSFVNSLN